MYVTYRTNSGGVNQKMGQCIERVLYLEFYLEL